MMDFERGAPIQILTVLIATVIIFLCRRSTIKKPSNPNWFEEGWGQDEDDDQDWGSWHAAT